LSASITSCQRFSLKRASRAFAPMDVGISHQSQPDKDTREETPAVNCLVIETRITTPHMIIGMLGGIDDAREP